MNKALLEKIMAGIKRKMDNLEEAASDLWFWVYKPQEEWAGDAVKYVKEIKKEVIQKAEKIKKEVIELLKSKMNHDTREKVVCDLIEAVAMAERQLVEAEIYSRKVL